MTTEGTLKIEWSIPEEQWQKARGAAGEHAPHSDYDKHALARNYLLYGDLDLVYGDRRLYSAAYGAKGVNISVLDLALALADAHLKQAFASGGNTTYEQLDDDRRIAFSSANGTIEVKASERPDALVVDAEPFVRGVVTFLCGFASVCNLQAERLMKWDTTAPLRVRKEVLRQLNRPDP